MGLTCSHSKGSMCGKPQLLKLTTKKEHNFIRHMIPTKIKSIIKYLSTKIEIPMLLI